MVEVFDRAIAFAHHLGIADQIRDAQIRCERTYEKKKQGETEAKE